MYIPLKTFDKIFLKDVEFQMKWLTVFFFLSCHLGIGRLFAFAGSKMFLLRVLNTNPQVRLCH